MVTKENKKKVSHSIQTKFDPKKNFAKKRNIIKIYEDFLTRVGLEKNPRDVNKQIIYVSLGILGFVFFLSIISGLFSGYDLVGFIPIAFLFSLSVAVVSFIAIHISFLVFLDLRIFKRTKEIEEHLPDFLQLTSVNISAGLPVDRALWYSVRSKFGTLAREIEVIAKETVTGKDLDVALSEFASKYDSNALKETVNLINEGIRSGGELSELLNSISENIYETRLMKKEIAASVMTYAIFIGVGSVIAAPLLLALSTQLLHIVETITSDMAFDSGAGGFQTFSFSTDGISIDDFRYFSVIMVSMTAFFSAAIVNVIRKGNIKDGFKLIPFFILVGLGVYFFSSLLFEMLLGGLV